MPPPMRPGADEVVMDSFAAKAQVSVPLVTPSPKNLRVLVVDSKQQSRQSVVQLLRDCQYQVHSVKTSKEALCLLAPAAAGNSDPPFDIILKEHEPDNPSPANACRLLRQMAHTELLARIPVVVVSSNDEREVVVKCLTLGAIDYLIKPLRHNELRHIWTRVWWWRRSGLGGNTLDAVPKPVMNIDTVEFQISSEDSKYTKCSDDEEEPTSKEGSAPDICNASNENGTSGTDHGSNGNTNGTSRVEAKPRDANGSSGNNGNSATKEDHNNGSNGNGNSTTLAERNALVNTAEGKAPATQLEAPVKPASRSSFQPYTAQPHKKRALSGQLQISSDVGQSVSGAARPHSQQAAAVEKDAQQQLPQPPPSPLVQRLLSKGLLQLGGSGSSSGNGPQMAAKPGSNSSGGCKQALAGATAVAAANGQATKASGGLGSPAEGSGGALLAHGGGAILSSNPSTHLSSEDTLLRNSTPASVAVAPQVASSAPVVFRTTTGDGTGPSSAVAAASAAANPHPHHHAAFAHAAGSQATTSAAASMQFARAMPGGASVWMGQHVALHHLQAAMHGGVPPPMHPYAPPHGYPGPVYPQTPYGHLVGIPPHLLQQMHPQLLRSLYAASYNHGNHGSHATDANGRLTPAAVLLALQGHELPAAAAAAAATEAAALEAAARGVRDGGRGVTPPPPHLTAALKSLAPDVAAAAIAAAAGNYNPLMLMQYLAQTGQASPLQLQQLAAVHQAGPAAAAAAWHAAGSAQQQQQQAPLLPSPGHPLPSYPAPVGPVANRSTPPPPPVPSCPVKVPECAEESFKGAGSGLRLSSLPEPRKRRAMALDKYRKKRKNLKFAKTIRYESRKQLAQTRPRIKGQFVKFAPSEAGVEDSSGAMGCPGNEADMAVDCEEEAQARYGGQNFDEEGQYDGEDDAMEAEEDEEGGAGGSGTEAGDCKRRCKEMLDSSPEAEPTPLEDDLLEEDDEVVNSLQKLREGAPKDAGQNCPDDVGAAVAAMVAVSRLLPQPLVPQKVQQHQQQENPVCSIESGHVVRRGSCKASGDAGSNGEGNAGKHGSDSGSNSRRVV